MCPMRGRVFELINIFGYLFFHFLATKKKKDNEKVYT